MWNTQGSALDAPSRMHEVMPDLQRAANVHRGVGTARINSAPSRMLADYCGAAMAGAAPPRAAFRLCALS